MMLLSCVNCLRLPVLVFHRLLFLKFLLPTQTLQLTRYATAISFATLVSYLNHQGILTSHVHTLLPAIETTDVIGNTDDKQVKRNMGRYFQHNFMLFMT